MIFNEVVGTSKTSWEDAALAAMQKAQESGQALSIAEVVEQDLDLTGDEVLFRSKLSVSLKYQDQ